MWTYDLPASPWLLIGSCALVAIVLLCCLFPLAPYQLKIVVVYISLGLVSCWAVLKFPTGMPPCAVDWRRLRLLFERLASRTKVHSAAVACRLGEPCIPFYRDRWVCCWGRLRCGGSSLAPRGRLPAVRCGCSPTCSAR